MAMKNEAKQSIPATFMDISHKRDSKIAIRHKNYGLWEEISWIEYYRQSAYVTHALMKLGIEPGDFVGIIGENCPEWLYMDMGIQMAGARTVGIYTTNAWQQVRYVLKHSQCKILFAENEEQVDKWFEMRDDLPDLEYVIYWDKKGLERINDPKLLFYDDIMAEGKRSFVKDPDLHISRVNKVSVEDIAFLVYTSGTTGKPKGAMLTARNILWVANTLKDKYGDFIKETDQTMSFLPLCHIFERMFGVYLPLVLGYVINIAESPDTIAQNIREIRPTVGYAVPRVWEKFQSSVFIKIGDAPWLNRQLFKIAMTIGQKYSEKELTNKRINFSHRIQRFIAYWTILYPLKYMMGMNRMRCALSGAAPISPKVLQFYHLLGITMLEGYGMTETCALISLSTPSEFKLGAVGKPLFGSEVKLSDDGEIVVRHPGVISGYYKYPEATASAFVDGWLHTGDVGVFDDGGFLSIVDRKKDIIITAGGKNIAPQKIENKLKVSHYINDAIVIGDKKKFLSALIVLDEENINKYARDEKIPYSAYSELANHPKIKELIDHQVREVNKELARVETLRKFTILDKRLYVEDGEVTPTMKVKRKFINEQYQDLIEQMYIS
jgi:long-chain acyl-CoA synthetase